MHGHTGNTLHSAFRSVQQPTAQLGEHTSAAGYPAVCSSGCRRRTERRLQRAPSRSLKAIYNTFVLQWRGWRQHLTCRGRTTARSAAARLAAGHTSGKLLKKSDLGFRGTRHLAGRCSGKPCSAVLCCAVLRYPSRHAGGGDVIPVQTEPQYRCQRLFERPRIVSSRARWAGWLLAGVGFEGQACPPQIVTDPCLLLL